MRRFTFCASGCFALLLLACGDSSESNDAGVLDGGALDAGGDTTPGGDAGPADAGMRCDLSPEPTPLPAIAGTFAVADDGDGGSNVPVPAGGDPTGVWVFDRATFYVTREAAEMFDVEMSEVQGTAWVAFDGSEARLDFDLVTTLRGTIAGTVLRPNSTQIEGSYVVDGARIVITPACVQRSATGGGSGGGLEFSASGDEATFFTRLNMATGMVSIVLEGTRRTE